MFQGILLPKEKLTTADSEIYKHTFFALLLWVQLIFHFCWRSQEQCMPISFEVLEMDFIRNSTATFTQKSHKAAVKTTLRYIGFAFLHWAQRHRHNAAPVCDFK